MSRKILILGGALSGPTAAARARETDGDAQITLIERGADISYAVGGLPYHLSGEVEAKNDLAPHRAAFFKQFYGVDVHTGVSVISFDPARREVRTSAGTLAYDSLVYALGAGSVTPPVLGEAAPNLSLLRNMGHLRRIAGLLDAGARRVVVVGGGFYGVEAAECLARRGCEVTLVERSQQLLPVFSAGAAGRAATALQRLGVKVMVGADVRAVQREAAGITALQVAAETIPAQLVIVSAGVRPRTAIFAAAGGEVREDGSIGVDDRCRTNLQHVYATSICVSHQHAVSGELVWTAQAADADKSAQVAGANAAGGDVQLKPTLGTAILRVGDLTLGRTGLTNGAGQATVRLDSHACDPFFAVSPLAISLFFDPHTQRVQGAEVVGVAGVDKRVDVIATAIAGRMTVTELAQVDLAYSPPYGLARDPVNAVANIAAQSAGVRAWSPEELGDDGQTLYLDVRPAPTRAPAPFNARSVDLASLRGLQAEMVAASRVIFISERGRSGYLAARSAVHLGANAGYLAGGMRAWRERT